MKRARENRDRLVAVGVATAAADTVVAAKAASEEATDNFANRGSRGQMGRAGFEPAKA